MLISGALRGKIKRPPSRAFTIHLFRLNVKHFSIFVDIRLVYVILNMGDL
jgi:hypothetical protein